MPYPKDYEELMDEIEKARTLKEFEDLEKKVARYPNHTLRDQLARFLFEWKCIWTS